MRYDSILFSPNVGAAIALLPGEFRNGSSPFCLCTHKLVLEIFSIDVLVHMIPKNGNQILW